MTNADGYLIGTEAECLAYDSAVTAGEGYNGTTTRWAEPRQHPTQSDLYAIIKHTSYDDTMQWVEVLDETWNQDILN